MRKFFTLHYWGLCWKFRNYGHCAGATFTMADGTTGHECGAAW